MIIRLNFDDLVKGMQTVNAVVSDKALKDNMKNMVLWVTGETVRLAANSFHIASAEELAATVTYEEGENQEDNLILIRAKDITNLISSFAGLKRTKVDYIEFEPNKDGSGVFIRIKEMAIDEDMANANAYNQISRYRFSRENVLDNLRREVTSIVSHVEGELVPSVNFNIYMDALYPTVAKETRDNTSYLMFSDKHVYTFVNTYVAMLENKLPEVFRDFKLSNNIALFIKGFISGDENFVINKTVGKDGVVLLTLQAGKSVAVIKCPDMSRAFILDNFLDVPENGIEVDKIYLRDVLKRMELGSDTSLIEIMLERDETTGATSSKFVVSSEKMRQEIPVDRAKGQGNFSFNLRSEQLKALIFSHTDMFEDKVFIYLEINDKGQVEIACGDNQKFWRTRSNGVAQAKSDFRWE